MKEAAEVSQVQVKRNHLKIIISKRKPFLSSLIS